MRVIKKGDYCPPCTPDGGAVILWRQTWHKPDAKRHLISAFVDAGTFADITADAEREGVSVSEPRAPP